MTARHRAHRSTRPGADVVVPVVVLALVILTGAWAGGELGELARTAAGVVR